MSGARGLHNAVPLPTSAGRLIVCRCVQLELLHVVDCSAVRAPKAPIPNLSGQIQRDYRIGKQTG